MSLCSSRCARPAVRQASRHALILSTGKVVVLAAAPLQVPPLKAHVSSCRVCGAFELRGLFDFLCCVFFDCPSVAQSGFTGKTPKIVIHVSFRFTSHVLAKSHAVNHAVNLTSSSTLQWASFGGWVGGGTQKLDGGQKTFWVGVGRKTLWAFPHKVFANPSCRCQQPGAKKAQPRPNMFFTMPPQPVAGSLRLHLCADAALHNPGIPCRAG